MKIALIGYGKMGKIIENIAKKRGHEIVSIIDIHNPEDFESDDFKSADVAIEFTAPQVAVDNIRKSFAANVPVVSGTTGWHDHLPDIQKEIIKNNNALFWSSNFSLGVFIFNEINVHLAKLMNQFSDYSVKMTEVHHTQKLDAPSGTAITLAENIIDHLDRKKSWSKEKEHSAKDIAIKSIREGQVPGIHTVEYDSSVDSITISHSAKSREGFALGAVIAAEFIAGKTGYFTMHDMIKLD